MAIKYPIKKTQVKHITQSRRGMNFEEDINASNEYYNANELCVIHKKPTPVQIVKVDYPRRSAAVISEAYFKTPSTTDYNGIYKGKYIDFEAKESKSKTSFPLSNIHPHQIKHLEDVCRHGGIGFILVRFSVIGETYFLHSKIVSQYYNASLKGERKSIPLDTFKEQGHLIKDGAFPRIDYLKVVDLYL